MEPPVKDDLYLYALQMMLKIPPYVKTGEVYLEEPVPGHATWVTTFDAAQRQWRLELRWGTQRQLYNDRGMLFVRGHEEGHICEMTGNLAVLYEEAARLGFDYNFFSRENAERSDKQVLDILQTVFEGHRRYEDVELGSLPAAQAELTAHVAGMIALVKAEGRGELIRIIDEKLRRPSFIVPDIPGIVREHCGV